MTHDELVSAIKKGIVMTGNRLASHEEGANLYRRTVLAVVELHRPTGSDLVEGLLCLGCPMGVYPCHTIKAIEKELA